MRCGISPSRGPRSVLLTADELEAASRFEAAGVHCDGIAANTIARVLYEVARQGVTTNSPGPLGRLGRKDQLEYALRWYVRATGRRVRRPETHPSIGACVKAAVLAFGNRDCILKPANSGGGRGIRLVDSVDSIDGDIDPGAQFVVQELLRNPLLLEGFKADLRCYLLITPADRSRSRRIGPVLVRTAPVPYTRLLPAAEITNTSFRRRLGLEASIRPFEVAFANEQSLATALRSDIEKICEAIVDFVFAWRDEHLSVSPFPSQALLWGIDLLACGRPVANQLNLLEINMYPQLYRSDDICDALVDEMLVTEYLPELLSTQSGFQAARVVGATAQ